MQVREEGNTLETSDAGLFSGGFPGKSPAIMVARDLTGRLVKKVAGFT